MSAVESTNMSPVPTSDVREMTARIVSAHVGNNTIAIGDLPALIAQVYGALAGLDKLAGPLVEQPQPAVPIKKSVTPDWIICLEDGKKLKMLKRHLSSAYNMTPDQYRERWGLPADYPMVAPAYARQRSVLAKTFGLGTRRAVARPVEPAVAPAKRSRARRPV